MIINILTLSHFYGISEEIEIAKGKNKLPLTFKEAFQQLKRKSKFKK